MSVVALELRREDTRRIARLASEWPREARRAHAAVAAIYRNKLGSALESQGGKYGVPRFAPPSRVTRALRWRNTVGGVLTRRESVVRYRRGDAQVIGWPDGLEPYATPFQTSETRDFTRDERRSLWARMRARGVAPAKIREALDRYVRPARPVIQPFGEYVAREWPSTLARRLEAMIAKAVER